MTDIRPDFDRAARDWDRLNALPRPVSVAVAEALPEPPSGALILDLGCGTGEPGFSVRARYPNSRLLGIDTSSAMIEMARAKAERDEVPDARFEVMAMEQLDVESATVDVLVSRFGFLGLSDTADEAARVLRPGGRYSFAVWDRSELNTTMHVFFTALRRSTVRDQTLDLRIFDEMADDRRERWLRAAGMASIRTALFEWTYSLADFDAVLELFAAPPFGDALAALPEDERAVVHRDVADQLTPYRGADGSYDIPQTCRLFWGER
jgi:ubiquinone/menaquinone biosynthesis C-methylase UbiE